MVHTRSQAAPKPTASKDDKGSQGEPNATKSQPDQKSSPPRPAQKRKADTPSSSTTKKQKRATNKDDTDSPSDAVIINRSPVLHLWSACVAHAVHPELSWDTCLSIGSAIASITAVAKGRAIGKIEPKDPAAKEGEEMGSHPAQHDAGDEDEEVEVMHFKLRIRDGRAVVGRRDEKGKPGDEEALKRKYGGGGAYEKVKGWFEDCLREWPEGDRRELNGRAFGFYEEFRPTVRPGQAGWGRKGELRFETIRDVVKR